MAFADQLAALKTHAVAAGTAVSPAITDVQVGYPIPGSSRCVRLFYDGEEDPELIAGTFTEDNVAEVVHVSAFWSLSNYSPKLGEQIETQLYAFKHAFRTNVDASQKLGGTCTAVTVRNADPGYAIVGGVEYRVLDIDVAIEYTSYPLS